MKEEFIKDVGIKHSIDKKSIIIQILAIGKKNISFTDDDIKNFIKIWGNYLDSISNNKNSIREYFGEIMTPQPNNQIENQAFYKFTSQKIYEIYLKRGKFQLGSLLKYREIENQSSRDEKEGLSNIIIKSTNREILSTVLSGLNYYILCGTYNLDNRDYMVEKYGSKILKIPNVKSFANSLCKSIGAKKWYLQKVQYSDFKAYKLEYEIRNLEGVMGDYDTLNEISKEDLFNCLYKNSFSTSLFVKPTRFNKDQELRLVFEMSKDVRKELNFDNLGLLKQIQICR